MDFIKKLLHDSNQLHSTPLSFLPHTVLKWPKRFIGQIYANVCIRWLEYQFSSLSLVHSDQNLEVTLT